MWEWSKHISMDNKSTINFHAQIAGVLTSADIIRAGGELQTGLGHGEGFCPHAILCQAKLPSRVQFC